MKVGKAVMGSAWMLNRHAKNLIFLIIVSLLLVLFNLVAAPKANAADVSLGKITGQVFDKENGQPLLGASVAVQGTSLGAITDLDGNFRINKVPVGIYTLVVSSVGFTKVTMTEVTVKENESTPVNFIMESEIIKTEGIKVEAKADNNSQAILLHKRRNASAVTDGVSAQEMARSGSGDAAEAMTKVTGASVVDGKYVMVRGLGDRYANTTLNGSTLPTPDPDKQAVPMDLIPTGMLDNIVIEKSFTPDKPGDFAGGSVNLITKDYPETRSLVFSTSAGSNSETRYGEEILMQQSSSKDWLGFDDGQRDIPQIILDNPESELGQKGISFEINESGLGDSLYLVQYYEDASKAFNPEMSGKNRQIPLNQSHSLSYGNQHTLFNNPLGVVASLSYSRKYSSSNGIQGSYARTTNSSVLDKNFLFDDNKGTEEVLWGGLMNLKYGFHPNHKIGWNLMHTRNGESKSRFLIGEWAEYIPEGELARNQALWYTERKLTTNQFSGEHALFDNKIRAEWQISLSNTKQDEPDIRFLTDEVTFSEEKDSISGLPLDTTYQIVTSHYSAPQRIWREIEEQQDEYQANFTIPLSAHSKFKHGILILNKHRDASERRFGYINTANYINYNGDIDAYINDIGLDTVTTRVVGTETRYRYRFTNLLKENVDPTNSYNGDKEVFATYAMFELPLILNTMFVGGVRYEETEMHTKSTKTGMLLGKGISEVNVLPSLNLIYRLGDKMNVRASATKTLARPNLLELSSTNLEGFNDGDIYTGNPNLKMTKIDNYDLRWEWFVSPGEIIAVSGFYKNFKDPIEEVILHPIHFEIQPQNAENASLFGFELEYRRRMGFITEKLRNFRLGGNFTYVKSEIKLTKEELDPIRNFVDPNFPDTRPLAGQSPYLANLDFGFDSFKTGTSLSMFYNVFGRRLKFNSQGATPDVYEQPRHLLDFTGSQRLLGGSTFKVSVKNILNQSQEFLYDDLGGRIDGKYAYKSYSLGVSYSVGVSYQVW